MVENETWGSSRRNHRLEHAEQELLARHSVVCGLMSGESLSLLREYFSF